MNKEEFLKKLIEIEKTIDKSKWKMPYFSMYDMSFLNGMIKGYYDNKSLDSFESKKDRRLFEKYSKLSKEEQIQEYEKLKIKLNKHIKK